jgi:transposase
MPREAAAAAQVAVQTLVRERNELIVAALRSGMSLRTVGVVFGLSHEMVRKVSTRERGELTEQANKVQPPKV